MTLVEVSKKKVMRPNDLVLTSDAIMPKAPNGGSKRRGYPQEREDDKKIVNNS